jgi:cytoskeletal protein RodZ
LRSDYAHRFFGLRVNEWASIVVFLGALAWFVRHRAVFDESPYTRAREQAEATADAVDAEASESPPGGTDESPSDASPPDESSSDASPPDESSSDESSPGATDETKDEDDDAKSDEAKSDEPVDTSKGSTRS